MTKVINLMGGPGTGKSTIAAGLFYTYKTRDMNVEIAREYAKDVVWEGRFGLLENQIYLFAKQLKRMVDLKDKVDVIITDSPLLLSIVYANLALSSPFYQLVIEEYGKFDNINIFLKRKKAYNPSGRVQTEDEALIKDREIRFLLDCTGVKYVEVDSDMISVLDSLSDLW